MSNWKTGTGAAAQASGRARDFDFEQFFSPWQGTPVFDRKIKGKQKKAVCAL